MRDKKSAFLAQVKRRTASLSTMCPGFEVFEIAEGKLLDCIQKLEFNSFSGDADDVMNRLQGVLEKERSDEARWGLAYIDLWFCNNFQGVYWAQLVQRDQRNIRFAIQAAMYVWLSSGKDSSTALTRLITASSCTAEARRYLTVLGEKSDWLWWVKKVLPKQLRKDDGHDGP